MDPSKPKDTPSSASRRQAQQDAYDDLLEGFSWFSTKSSPLYTTTYGLSSSTDSGISTSTNSTTDREESPQTSTRDTTTPPTSRDSAGNKIWNPYCTDKTWASLFSEPAAEHAPSPSKTDTTTPPTSRDSAGNKIWNPYCTDKTWASLFSEPAAEHVPSPPKTDTTTPTTSRDSAESKIWNTDKSWASLFSEPAAEHVPSPPKTDTTTPTTSRDSAGNKIWNQSYTDKSWASLFSEPATEDVTSPSNTGGHFSLFSDGSTDNIDEAEINAFEKAEGPIPHHIMQMWSLPHPTEEFMNSMLSKKDYGPVGSKRKQGPPPPVAQRESGSECGFCRHNGEMRSVWASHNLKDSKGNVVCPILRRHVCRLCGATREKAHTLKYCPKCVITDDCFIHCPSCCPIFKETD